MTLPLGSRRALRIFCNQTSSKLVFLNIVNHLTLFVNKVGHSKLGLVYYNFVSNEKLLAEYSQNLEAPKLNGLLHDLAIYKEVLRLKAQDLPRISKSIIWVGDSE